MLNRFRTAVVASSILVFSLAFVDTGPVSAATKTTTKRRPVTTKRPTTTKAKPSTTKPPTTVSKLAQAKVDALAAYPEFVKSYTAAYRDTRTAPQTFPLFMTGDGLKLKLAEAKEAVAADSSFEIVKWDNFDLEVIGATETSVRLYVCIRTAGTRRRNSDNSVFSLPGDISPYKSEKEYVFDKSKTTGKWMFSADYHREDVEGSSTCADGR